MHVLRRVTIRCHPRSVIGDQSSEIIDQRIEESHSEICERKTKARLLLATLLAHYEKCLAA